MVGNATQLVTGTVQPAKAEAGKRENPPFQRVLLTGLTRLELAASGVTDRHSNQLSYSPSKQ